MRKLFRILYMIIGKRMPLSNSKFNIGQKKIRYYLTKRFIDSIGLNVNIEKGASFPYSIKVGDNSGLGVRCEINGTVEIGSNVLMGPDVVIYTQNHSFINKNVLIKDQKFLPSQKVTIGDDVWIGRRVIILPGVNIGNGAVIGAGAVVAKDIPEYAIAVGNPIVIKGFRKLL